MSALANSAARWRGRWTIATLVLCLTPRLGLTAPLPAEEARRLLAEGLEHFYNLEYDPAISIFERLQDDDPRAPKWHNHVALAYLYKQLHIAGALEGDLFGASNKFFRTKKITPDPVLENRFRQANQAAVRLCEQRLKQDRRDERALYSCGVAYAMRATHQALIERSLLDSLGSARKANDYHTRLARLNPRFYDAYLIPGLYDFVLGSLPAPIKVIFFFAGLAGDKQRGIGLVEKVVAWGDGARHDARILLTVMYRREKRFEDARRNVQALADLFPRNYILPLEVASLHRAAEETSEAIREYERVLELARSGVPNYSKAPVARIHFELAVLHQLDDDPEAALRHARLVAGARGSTPELEAEAAKIQRHLEEQLSQQKAQVRVRSSAQ